MGNDETSNWFVETSHALSLQVKEGLFDAEISFLKLFFFSYQF